MSTPFQDFLREKEYIGPPLVVSRQWPPPEGVDFVEVGREDERGVATVQRGRLFLQDDQGVPTWTWVKLLRPYDFTIGFILTYYGAQLKGGARILAYCQTHGEEFLVVEEKHGIDLPRFLQSRAAVGRNVSDETERKESIAYEMSRQVVNNHDIGVFHGDLDVHNVIVETIPEKTTFGPGDVHLEGYQRAGTVSDRFRDENMGVRLEEHQQRYEISSSLEGNDRLLLEKRSDVLTPAPRIDDPLASFYVSLDSLLGNTKPEDAVGSVKEKLLDRFHLADTVFRLFGGDDVYSPKPRYMPQELYQFLVGLTASDATKRFHPESALQKHSWMKRRAAIAAAVSKGGKPTDAEPTRGETLRTLWTPAPAKQAEDTRDASDVSEPVTLLAKIVEGAGGAGEAAIEADAGAASPGPMTTLQEVQPESPPESGSGPGSRSWWDSGLVSRSILPTVSESETSPVSRRDSWTDSSSDDGGGRLSRPTGTDNGVGICGGGKAKGWSEGAGKGEGTEKDEDVLADGGTRAMRMWSTVAAGGLSDSEKEGVGSANADAAGTFKRKRLEGDAASHGSVGKSRKRCRQSPGSDGRGPSRAPPAAPVAVADENRAVPEGSSFIRPFMGANIVEVYSPADLCSVAEPAYGGLQWCWGSDDEGADSASSYPDAHGNGGSSSGGGGIGGGVGGGACVMGSCFGARFPFPP